MMQCQIRVITNGYILSYMSGNDLFEMAFTSRKDLFDFINEQMTVPLWEEMA